MSNDYWNRPLMIIDWSNRSKWSNLYYTCLPFLCDRRKCTQCRDQRGRGRLTPQSIFVINHQIKPYSASNPWNQLSPRKITYGFPFKCSQSTHMKLLLLSSLTISCQSHRTVFCDLEATKQSSVISKPPKRLLWRQNHRTVFRDVKAYRLAHTEHRSQQSRRYKCIGSFLKC